MSVLILCDLTNLEYCMQCYEIVYLTFLSVLSSTVSSSATIYAINLCMSLFGGKSSKNFPCTPDLCRSQITHIERAADGSL